MTQVLYILFADVISLVFLASYWAILAHFGLGIFFPSWCISIGLLLQR